MNFTILTLIITIIVGIYLRILPYDNVQGLWNDEYVSWYISQKPLFIPFIKSIFEQCHMPFYYLYLKFITLLLGNSDFILRFSSLITGTLSIIAMYFVGRTKNNILGILCALFTSVSGILIYYSYEVRPYSLIFLFSALSLLFTIKIIENPKKNITVWYVLSNLAILFTHTIGFIYVVCNFIFVSYYLKKRNLKLTKTIFLSIGIFFMLLTPLIINIFTTISFSQWWSNFSFSKLLFMFTDMFSSCPTNLINAPNSFISQINIKFLIFGIIPSIICITGIIYLTFILKENLYKNLLLTALIPTFILLFASITGKLVFLTKYNFEIYPILIYIALYGLFELKNKKLRISLLISLFILNTTYIFTPEYKAYFYKSESHKLVADLLNNAKLKPDDIIIFTYYPRERFSKYFDYSPYEIREIHKGNFFYYLTPNTTYKDAVIHGNKIYKKVYKSNDNKHFKNAIEKEFYQNLTSGKKIAIIFLNSVSMLSDIQIYKIASDDKYYNKIPQMFMIFSYVKNFLIKKMYADLKLIKIEEKGDWAIVVFEKS